MRRTFIAVIFPALLLMTATMVSQAQSKPGNEPASQPSTRPYCIVDTNQTQCYSDRGEITPPKPGQPFYGQDAQFAGKQPSLTLSQDGKSVYDNNTGLIWMRSPNLTNTPPVRGDKLTYPAAQAWVKTVNAARYGGFADWRLPTIKELYSIFDCRGTDPSSFMGSDTSVLTPFIDKKFFRFAWGDTSSGERIIDSQYATNTLFVMSPSGSGFQKLFGVNFADGRIKGYDLRMPDGFTQKTFFVQLVRGNPDYGKNDFIDNKDQTITDRATGLMWSKEDNKKALNWQDALAWVEARNKENYLGYNDWRMPNVKELQSIVDYANAPDFNGLPAVDTRFFTCSSITNEAGQADFPYYWTGTTHAGYNGPGARGTRGGGPPPPPGGPGGVGGQADYVPFGRALGWPGMQDHWVDIHGAGCQRSDPKVAPPFPYATVHTTVVKGVTYTGYSFGPQGDAIRGLNYIRLVRGGDR